jgi:hypothetical protein
VQRGRGRSARRLSRGQRGLLGLLASNRHHERCPLASASSLGIAVFPPEIPPEPEREPEPEPTSTSTAVVEVDGDVKVRVKVIVKDNATRDLSRVPLRASKRSTSSANAVSEGTIRAIDD